MWPKVSAKLAAQNFWVRLPPIFSPRNWSCVLLGVGRHPSNRSWRPWVDWYCRSLAWFGPGPSCSFLDIFFHISLGLSSFLDFVREGGVTDFTDLCHRPPRNPIQSPLPKLHQNWVELIRAILRCILIRRWISNPLLFLLEVCRN